MVNGNRLYRKGSHCTACDAPPGAVANRIQSASEANGSSETRSRRRGDQRVHLDSRLPAVAGQGRAARHLQVVVGVGQVPPPTEADVAPV